MKLLCVRRWLSFFLIGPGKRLQLFFLLGAQAKAIAHGRLSKKRMAAERDACSRYEERLASRQDRTPKNGILVSVFGCNAVNNARTSRKCERTKMRIEGGS
jgi:hypothetical protein